jgi:hypothetical protein
LKKIKSEALLATYQTGFNHIEELVRGIKYLTPSSADIFLDAVLKANEEQLAHVRNQRTQLEIEIKKFLAYANSKMEYLAGLERYLLDQQAKAEQLAAEARQEEEDCQDGQQET